MSLRHDLPRRLGDYVLTEFLAAGGMGELFRGRRHDGRGPEVVLKCVGTSHRDTALRDRVEMLLHEARVATLLDHPNIVRVFEVDWRDGVYFLVMEMLEGWDLYDIQEQASRTGQLFPMPLALAWAAQAARGLHSAHTCATERGEPLRLVHRDINPANLFLTRHGVLKILDFGLARTTIRMRRTGVGVLKGKLAYMAPEQYEGTDTDHRCDIFALGVVLHELITGRRLFKRPNFDEIRHAITRGFVPPPMRADVPVPESLAAIVMRALQRDRGLRYDSAEQMADELAAVQPVVGTATDTEAAAWLSGCVTAASARARSATAVGTESLGAWAKEIGAELGHPLVDAAWSWVRDQPRRAAAIVGVVSLLALASLWLASSIVPDADAGLPAPSTSTAPLAEPDAPMPTPIPSPAEPTQPPPEPPPAEPAPAERAHKPREAVTASPLPTNRVVRRPSPTGRLTLEVKPWARVYLGRKFLGVSPLVEVELPAGRSELRLVNPDTGMEKTISVVITPGEVLRTGVDLRLPAP